eukprot:scaffold117179_cov28-Tisochrysis_lutea.AAC.6
MPRHGGVDATQRLRTIWIATIASRPHAAQSSSGCCSRVEIGDLCVEASAFEMGSRAISGQGAACWCNGSEHGAQLLKQEALERKMVPRARLRGARTDIGCIPQRALALSPIGRVVPEGGRGGKGGNLGCWWIANCGAATTILRYEVGADLQRARALCVLSLVVMRVGHAIRIARGIRLGVARLNGTSQPQQKDASLPDAQPTDAVVGGCPAPSPLASQALCAHQLRCAPMASRLCLSENPAYSGRKENRVQLGAAQLP